MIISVINNKGGVGKTTTATILAELASRERKAQVIAADVCGQQNMIDNLTGDNDESLYGIELLPSPDRTPQEKKLREYDYAIIDTPPTTQSSVVRNVIEYSDVVVVPFKPEKHAIFGLDTVSMLIPEGKKVMYLCVSPSRIGVSQTGYIELVKEEIQPLFRWPMLLRVQSNVDSHLSFDRGLKEDEKKAFADFFKAIKKGK